MMDNGQLRRDLAQNKYEVTPEGLYFPRAQVLAKGRFVYNKRGEPAEYSDNLLVTQGLTHLVGSALGAETQVPTWYIAIFSGNVTVLASWTAANFTANATEITAYDETTRVQWTPTAAANGLISSYTDKSTFTANASVTVRGAALLSSSAKSGTTGVLMGASRFGSDKALSSGETVDIGYQVQLTAV